MKTYIKKHPFNTTTSSPVESFWYSWTESCDRCGRLIKNTDDFYTTIKPNTNEKDYCINCLRELLKLREEKI